MWNHPSRSTADVSSGRRHRANRGGFGEAVHLQNSNPEHHEKELGFASEGRGAANQRAKIRSQPFANGRKNQEAGESQPEKIPRLGRFVIEPGPRGFRAIENPRDHSAALFNIALDAAANAFEQRGHIQKVIGRCDADFLGKFRKIHRHRKLARS